MFNQPGRTFTMVMNRKMQKEVVLYFFPGSCVEIKNHVVFGVRAPVQVPARFCKYVLYEH